MIDTSVKITADDFRFNPPSFREDELATILAREFDIAGELQALVGERDQNTRVTTSAGRQYVLKLSSPDETWDAVDLQIKALEHIHRVDPQLEVPVHVATRDGSLVTEIVDQSGLPHHVRLLTYVEGTPLLYTRPASLVGVRKTGALLGRLCRALADFEHHAADHFMPWDIMNGVVVNGQLIDRYLPPVLHERCAPVIERLRDSSLQAMEKLPAQVIHSDVHAGNLLTSADNPDQVHGIIDFGDLVRRPLVVDLAGALANLVDQYEDVTSVSQQFLHGFREYIEIDEEQLDLLYDATCAREILTVLLFNLRIAELPYDAELVNVYLPMTLRGLDRLLSIEQEYFVNAMKKT